MAGHGNSLENSWAIKKAHLTVLKSESHFVPSCICSRLSGSSSSLRMSLIFIAGQRAWHENQHIWNSRKYFFQVRASVCAELYRGFCCRYLFSPLSHSCRDVFFCALKFIDCNSSSEVLSKSRGHWSIAWLKVGAGKVDKIWLNIVDLIFPPSYVSGCASGHISKWPFSWNSALFLLPFITLGEVPLDETFVVLRLPARVQTLYFWHWSCRFPEAT